LDHIRINLEQDVRSGVTNGLENFNLVHDALPEIDLERVDLSLSLFGKKLAAPLLISSMTGGTDEAAAINRSLAAAAQAAGVAMGLGSQRAPLEDARLAGSYRVRDVAPDILLFANLGAVQLNYGYSIDECRRAVEMVAADGLILHLNPLQEALQPEGNTHFSDLLTKIEQVCRLLSVPVIVKEVGWGISAETAISLASAGVAAIDVAGAGGTSWSQVEMYRTGSPRQARVAAAFKGWGIPTAETLRSVHESVPHIPVFASGGLRDGIDVAKCIALGACLAGMAGPFLKAAVHGPEPALEAVNEVIDELRIAAFACGAADLKTLARIPIIRI
jgi:isopentenyl-diphosphate delta-isomerase